MKIYGGGLHLEIVLCSAIMLDHSNIFHLKHINQLIQNWIN